MESFNKQTWEEFEITGDFSRVMTDGETIESTSSSVVAYDKDGTDVSATIIPVAPTYAAQTVKVFVKAGTNAASPYKITFKVKTNSNNKWELDVRCYVKDI